MALRDNGELWGWGHNDKAMGLANGIPLPAATLLGVDIKDMSIGWSNLNGAAIKPNGDIYTWGYNSPNSNNALNCRSCVSTGTTASGHILPVLSDAFSR